MGKIFAFLVMFIFVANTCFAVSLELSDIIKQARESEQKKVAVPEKEEQLVKNVKSFEYKKELFQNQEIQEKYSQE